MFGLFELQNKKHINDSFEGVNKIRCISLLTLPSLMQSPLRPSDSIAIYMDV